MPTPAPRPGQSDEVAAAKSIVRITIKGDTHAFPTDLSFDDRAQVRRQTGGIPFESYWSGELAIGLDSVQVMWWLARKLDGEPNLLLRTVLETWPAELTEDDIAVDEITLDEDNPEV